MTNPASASTPPMMPLAKLARVLSDPTRWRILRELAKGEALPVQVLAGRAGSTPNLTSKHMSVLRKAGMVVVGYGRLYQLVPEMRPAPGAMHLDLGHCHLRLDTPL